MSPAKKEYLKRKNAVYVSLFVAWCIALYAAFVAGMPDSFDAIESRFSKLNAKSGVLLTLMPIVTLIISGILPAGTKASLVFLRIRHALPGHRAFTVIADRDPRIDTKQLAQKYGDLPSDPADQNTSWYSLYRKVDDVVTVREVHKNFLLARDLAVCSLTFGVFGGIPLAFASPSRWSALAYVGIMLIQYVLLAVAAQNYGRGLVSNVLVEYLSLDESNDSREDAP